MQVGRGDLLDDFASGGHFGEVGGSRGCAGGFPTGNHGAGENRLAIVNLTFGQFVFCDRGEAGRKSIGKELGKLLEGTGAKAERGQVLLVGASVAGEGDGGQKFLKRLVLLALGLLLTGFRFP